MISTHRFNNRMHQDLSWDRQDWSASSNWSTCAGVQATSLVSQKCVSCRAGKPHSSISLSPLPGTTCAQPSICRRKGYSWEPPAPSTGKQRGKASYLPVLLDFKICSCAHSSLTVFCTFHPCILWDSAAMKSCETRGEYGRATQKHNKGVTARSLALSS